MRLHALTVATLLSGLACAGAALAGPDAGQALERYVRKPQAVYAWSAGGVSELEAGVVVHDLTLTSQTWQGTPWEHGFKVMVPPAAQGERARPGHALLVITGSGGKQKLVEMLAPLTAHMGVPVAILFDVPNQPLFKDETPDGKGLREDAAIAHTFKKFVETGDPEQLLLLPMVRSAVSAMDALREFSQAQQAAGDWAFGTLDKFVTTGASKRGWTTWLTSVVEPTRVIGIAPIVYDNLNMKAQIDYHMEVWGAPSPSIHDYTDRGLLEMLNLPQAEDLVRIVDPYSYADRLDLPKLQLIGTNDSYWPLDAIHLYRGGLPGNLYCHYVPNAGHRAGLSVVWAISGFFDAVTGRIAPLPEVSLNLVPAGKQAEIGLSSKVDSARIKGVRLWGTHVEARDFREANWEQTAAERVGPLYRAPLPANTLAGQGGHAAYLGEVELYDSNGASFLWHSPVQVWETAPQE